MGDQLHADLDKIRDIGPGLRNLQGQYAKVTAVDQGTFLSEAGVPVLAQALAEFADDWNIRLRNLLNDLDDLARLSDAAAEAYAQADKDLSLALTRVLEPVLPPPAMRGHIRPALD